MNEENDIITEENKQPLLLLPEDEATLDAPDLPEEDGGEAVDPDAGKRFFVLLPKGAIAVFAVFVVSLIVYLIACLNADFADFINRYVGTALRFVTAKATGWIPFSLLETILLSIPILNIEEPVAEMAVRDGKKIGVLATIPTSPKAISDVIREKAHEAGKEIEIVEKVADGAFDALRAGDRDLHDAMVCKALYELVEEVDVIAFAQISMSLLKHDPVKVPVHKIGPSGLNRMKEMIGA